MNKRHRGTQCVEDEIRNAEAPVHEIGVAHFDFEQSPPAGEAAQGCSRHGVEPRPGIGTGEQARQKQASHEVAALVEVEVGVARPVVDPADRAAFLPLVPGAVEIAEPEIVDGRAGTAEGQHPFEADPTVFRQSSFFWLAKP